MSATSRIVLGVLLCMTSTAALQAQPSLHQQAETGHPEAQFELGQAYEYGRGLAQDDAEAIRWYLAAARQGEQRAQYRLGVLYDNGWGIAESDVEAVRWYRAAAEQGHPFAQHDLALMYAAGTGVPRSVIQAYMWLSIALNQGYPVMAKHLARVARGMSADQVAEAEALARDWLRSRVKLDQL